jgi:hypothetical protein
MQRWCFDQDFQRLGPSIFRVLEARLLGYQRLKHSSNGSLRQRAEYYATELRAAYPVFLAGRLLGPNASIRRWIGELEQRLHTELGPPSFSAQAKSILAVGAALWTGLTLKLNLFQHPKLTRTAYRMPHPSWSAHEVWENILPKVPAPGFSVQVDVQHAPQQVWMRLEGAPSLQEAEGLGQRIRESLARSKARLTLDMKNLQWDKINHLEPLREKLAAYGSRIELVLPKLVDHPELMLLARMFQHNLT